ncbi:MAG: hypothetical protein J0M10_17745 [Chitinophagales bacterium]|nr:hypothetical protein [Chitinophagales bacterium]
MEQTLKNDNWLAQWKYEPGEWNRFARWLLLRRGSISHILYFLNPFRQERFAQVKISAATVYVNARARSFRSANRKLIAVEIFSVGKLNILEIYYKSGKEAAVISVPVPKGKLKEAIILEKKLTTAG